MQKRIIGAMLALILLIFPTASAILVSKSHELMLERERNRALSEEAAISRALAMEIRYQSEENILSAAQTAQKRYGSDDLEITLLYSGRSVTGKLIPSGLKELLSTTGRATLLMPERETLYIAHAMNRDVTLLAASDLSAVYDLHRQMIVRAAFLCIAGIGISLILSVALSRFLMKPVRALSGAARFLGEGQYDTPLPPPRRDEIGELTRSFAAMSAAVREREEKLKAEAVQRQQLLDALSHEMRTPLTVLAGGSRLLQSGSLSREKEKDVLDMMGKEAFRLSTMEERLSLLMNLSHNEFERKNFSVEAMVREAASVFDDVTFSGTGGDIRGDRELMIELVRNLLVNAQRAGGSGRIWITLHEKGFSVTDDGRGMTKEVISRIFDPFYKADAARTRKTGGVGLGLTLCRKIAELHHGELTVESEIGKGTTVTYRQDLQD